MILEAELMTLQATCEPLDVPRSAVIRAAPVVILGCCQGI